ncbi:MAG: lysophospholipase [Rhodospirillaceae bacterium]|nr:lysophospholipase [Rhodospirillaceae bacterium]
MTIHLVKIAVGIGSVDHLREVQIERLRQAKESGGPGELRHLTRNAPRRAAEVLNGGSIYWIIKGYIRVRQRITDFGEAVGRNGKPRCALILDPKLVQTQLLPHKPIQGWRYMEPEAAPADLTNQERKIESSLPTEMADELRSLGLL